ncbi:MAG: hypothetical protein PVG99_13895 [Desulfobacteraceae bacterium]|jgi:hypothetical protein
MAHTIEFLTGEGTDWESVEQRSRNLLEKIGVPEKVIEQSLGEFRDSYRYFDRDFTCDLSLKGIKGMTDAQRSQIEMIYDRSLSAVSDEVRELKSGLMGLVLGLHVRAILAEERMVIAVEA